MATNCNVGDGLALTFGWPSFFGQSFGSFFWWAFSNKGLRGGLFTYASVFCSYRTGRSSMVGMWSSVEEVIYRQVSSSATEIGGISG